MREIVWEIFGRPKAAQEPSIFTEHILRPGDILDYAIIASDPMGETLEFGMEAGYLGVQNWQPEIHSRPDS